MPRNVYERLGGAPDPDSIRSKAKESGLDESTLRYRLKRGMTLEEAMTLVKTRSGKKKPPPPGLGRSGGKETETFHQYFVDTLRHVMGKDPLYRQK